MGGSGDGFCGDIELGVISLVVELKTMVVARGSR